MKKIKYILFPIIVISLASCSGNGSSTSSSSSSEPIKNAKIDLFCINDFHGHVEPEVDGYIYKGGISRLGTYLEKRKAENPDGSIFLNSGDLWQDTYESSLNKGELLTKAMVELNCEAMALGNHEFDWGINNIKKQKIVAESGESKFTFLGANIYNYTNGQATTQASDLCAEYKIVKKGNINIGIIGAIGKSQITSITSSIWENHTFLDPVPIVKSLSDNLRTKQGCDVIVYLFHGEADDASYKELSSISAVSNKPYVNAGFLGHSHSFQNILYNGVPWIQSYCHGAVLGHVSLNVTNESTTCTYYPDYSAEAGYKGRDENGYGKGASSIYACENHKGVKSIVDTYLTTSFIEERDKKAVTLSNHSGSVGKEAGKMLAKATSKTLDELRKKDSSIPNVDVVLNKGNRDTITTKTGVLTNANVFNLVPFENATHIARVKGSDIYDECVEYGMPYYLPGGAAIKIEKSKYYNVACIDYLLLHKNEYRQYNYFPSYTGSLYVLTTYSYEILISYFKNNQTFDMNELSGVAYTGLS